MKSFSGLWALAMMAGLGGSAFAADMPVKAPAPVAAIAAPYNWTGFYIGAQGGYAWGDSVQSFTGGTTPRYNVNGGAFGGTLGANWQMQQWVLGLEADYSVSEIKGNVSGSLPGYNCGITCETNVRSFGTFRARAGFAWDNVLFYGTGGAIYANIRSNLNGGTETHDRWGWTAGAGLEYGFARNWSAKVEWLYASIAKYQWTNASPPAYSCTGINCSTDAKFNLVRGGINFRF